MMVQAVLHSADLPQAPLDAAAQFCAEQVPIAREMLGGRIDALAIVFPAVGKPHAAWQLAVVQALAREAAPRRVNGVVGSGAQTVGATTDWLASAAGITGQLLLLHDG